MMIDTEHMNLPSTHLPEKFVVRCGTADKSPVQKSEMVSEAMNILVVPGTLLVR